MSMMLPLPGMPPEPGLEEEPDPLAGLEPPLMAPGHAALGASPGALFNPEFQEEPEPAPLPTAGVFTSPMAMRSAGYGAMEGAGEEGLDEALLPDPIEEGIMMASETRRARVMPEPSVKPQGY